jgi:adenylate cyclase
MSEDGDQRAESREPNGRLARAAKTLRRFDEHSRTVGAAKALRSMLPGDKDYGDPLSLGGSEPSHLLGQRLATVTAERPSAMREIGMSALQVWQAMAEVQGRGRGTRELAILFTDLVDFSDWALEAGDEKAVELLRCVGLAIEPPVRERGGEIVKRLGDGLMAVFDDDVAAVEAALESVDATRAVDVDGHNPQLRAGLHVGRPRRLGGDYLGVDVNVAARVAGAAGADEVLVSEDACRHLGDHGSLTKRRRRRFKAKGAPSDLRVFAVARD